MRISDWSSDVCSSDLLAREVRGQHLEIERARARPGRELAPVIQRVGEFRIEPADALELALAEIAADLHARERKSVVSGKSVSVRVDHGGRRIIKKKKRELLKRHDVYLSSKMIY